MSKRNTIRVAEFEKLYYDDSKPFRQKHWEALCSYQERSPIEYFKILNKGIQFTNYVGVIQAGNLTIEVLPKTDKGPGKAENKEIDQLNPQDKASRELWHDVLLEMLKECQLLQIHHVDYANLNLKSNSILEIYIEIFLLHAEKLLHEGLVKKYRKQEANQYALKGQLLFAQNISKNLVHQERFYIKYTEYNRTNIYNQLMYKTLCLITDITNNPFLTDKVNRLLLDFPEMPDCIVNASTFDKLVFDRKTERYKEPLLISKMLLLNYRPDIKSGAENVIAILFDMNKLWEEFVYRRLKKEEQEGIKVKRQQSRGFWKHEKSGRTTTIRPDIVVEYKGKTTIIDTKWKIIDNALPSVEDLRQMFAYNIYWNCDSSMLLYPSSKLFSEKGGYHHYEKNKEKEFHSNCFVETISVLSEANKLNKEIGKLIIDKLLALTTLPLEKR